jgi:Protein of unknown function (DUF3142)
MAGMQFRFGPFAAAVAVIALAGFALRSPTSVPSNAKESWKTGYWVWAGEAPVSAQFAPELLYVEVSTPRWPRDLLQAQQYVIVQRIEPATPLTAATASAIAKRYRALVATAGAGVHISGLQIDYDCPTRALASYAGFLKQLRQGLPGDASLSITALLDWFGPHTDLANTLRWVNEFVPQFYDTARERTAGGIGEPIDPAKWAPTFNRYQVPYRIGISSFGRIARHRVDAFGRASVRYFRDASPLTFAGRAQLATSFDTTLSGEIVVHYAVLAPIGDVPELRPGDIVEVTFPTEASVRAAYEAAQHFGGYCAGVVAFRWPGRTETLTLAPDDVAHIASGESLSAGARLTVRQAPCLERACHDLYLDLGPHIASAPRTLDIRTTGPVDLFLPGGPLHPSVARSHDILVRLPAFAGMGQAYLGRVISRGRVHFEVLEP